IPGEDGLRARPRHAAPGRRPDQERLDGVHQARMSRRRLSPIVALPFVLRLAWPIAVSADPVIVNDITQLNPIAVARVVTPRTVDEVRRSEEHTSELQSRFELVCRLLLEKKKKIITEKKILLWVKIKVLIMLKLLNRKPIALLLINISETKIKLITASAYK